MPEVIVKKMLDDLEYRGGAGQEVVATQTREITVDGKTFTICLSDDNAVEFDADMTRWTEHAEQVFGPPIDSRLQSRAPRAPRSLRPAISPTSREDVAAIREWARQQGFSPPVSDRGRLPLAVIEAYRQAHAESQPAA